MKNSIFVSLTIVLLSFGPERSYSQTSLYLVDTLTGTASNNKLWKAEGIGDFNGDGYADFVVCYNQYVDLYFGNAEFKPQLAHRFHYPPPGMHYNGAAYGIGDVNSDGFADIIIITGDTTYYPTYSYAEIIEGGKQLDTIPKFIFYPPYSSYWDQLIANKVYPLGDIDGDGYNDFAVSVYYNWDDGIGRVYIFKGGETLDDTSFAIIQSPLGSGDEFFGYSVLGIGDFNDEGHNDFLVSTHSLGGPGDTARVYYYQGNKDYNSVTSSNYYGPFNFITDVKSSLNLKRSERPSFILSAEGIHIYTAINTSIDFQASDIGYGKTIGVGGDINNDGFNDFLIGNENFMDSDDVMVGGAMCFWGDNNIDTMGNCLIEGHEKWESFSHDLDIPGDINGDGYADVFVLAPTFYKSKNYDYDSTLGRLYIYSYAKLDGIASSTLSVPKDFRLFQNYPNPFNPTTMIVYNLARMSEVKITIFNILGKEVKNFHYSSQSAGMQDVVWDGTDDNNKHLSSGVYLCHFMAKSLEGKSEVFEKTAKLIMLK